VRRLRSSAQLRSELLSVTGVELTGPIPSTEAHALLSTRERLSTTWALGETGTAGPRQPLRSSACIAVVVPRVLAVESGQNERLDNSEFFRSQRWSCSSGAAAHGDRGLVGQQPTTIGRDPPLSEDQAEKNITGLRSETSMITSAGAPARRAAARIASGLGAS